MEPIDITISHNGQSYALSLSADTTFSHLQAKLNELTLIPPANQKLLYKGRKPNVSGDAAISDAGIKSGTKVQLLGSTAQELGKLQQVESEYQRRERIMKERASKPQAKVRSVNILAAALYLMRFV